MSRVGKMPIVVPQGVDITAGAETISVKGSLGTLVRPVNRWSRSRRKTAS